eukprot:m.98323 g.98323  ORF g.98323 m.98323 type:complete len:165 (+) comp13123_c1_seq1:226-720(+)
MSAQLLSAPVIGPEVWEAYQSVSKGQSLASVFVLSEDEKALVIKGTVEIGQGCWQQLLELLDPQQVAWCAINLPYMTVNGGKRGKFMCLTWVPDTLTRSTFKETVRIKSTSLMLMGELFKRFAQDGAKRIQANDETDTEIFSVLDAVSKFERDAVDQDSILALL